MHIREATIEDLPALRLALWDACGEMAERYGIDRDHDFQRIGFVAEHGITHHDPVMVALDIDGKVVGFAIWASMSIVDKGIALHAAGTWVHQDWRRNGVSRKLREDAIHLARRKNYKKIIASVHESNLVGFASLQALGFKPTETIMELEL